MSRIERLTPDQEALIPVWREEFFRAGICTDPADRPRAEAAFARAYAAIGRKPVPTLWVGGPTSASLLLTLPQISEDSLRASLGDNLGVSLGDNLGVSLGDNLGVSLGDSLRASLWDSLEDSLRDSLWDSLRASLWDSLGASLWDSLRDSLGASLWDSLLEDGLQPVYWRGQWDLYWVAFYRCAARIGAQYQNDAKAKLDIVEEIGRSCHWWYPRDRVVIACERPSIIKLDDRERLHCVDGPALLCRDGWPVHAVHGVRVPARIIENKASITIDTISAERNAEIRRVMIELFGLDRYMRQAGGECVDFDERWGTLWRRELPDGPLQVLECINGTPEPDGSRRRYWLQVPPDVETALQAVAWTYDVAPEEYARLELRT